MIFTILTLSLAVWFGNGKKKQFPLTNVVNLCNGRRIFAQTVYLCLSQEPHNKQPFLLYTALTVSSLQRKHTVLSVTDSLNII